LRAIRQLVSPNSIGTQPELTPEAYIGNDGQITKKHFIGLPNILFLSDLSTYDGLAPFRHNK